MLEFVKAIIGDINHDLPDCPRKLRGMSIPELKAAGLTTLQAKRLHAAVGLAGAIAEPAPEYGRVRITGPEQAMHYCAASFQELIQYGDQEEFWVVTLDTKNQPIDRHLITKGTLRNSLVHPREVFRVAIRDMANCIIVVHNHPSGDPDPSDQDVSVTERLESAAEIIGIPVIDHIVVAKYGCRSIQQWRLFRSIR